MGRGIGKEIDGSWVGETKRRGRRGNRGWYVKIDGRESSVYMLLPLVNKKTSLAL